MNHSPCTQRLTLLATAPLVLLINLGCNPPAVSRNNAVNDTHPESPDTTPAASRTDSNGEARNILTTALDSWTFGDSAEKFKQQHATISFFDISRTTNEHGELLRYEILNGRESNRSDKEVTCEFNATLVFSGSGGPGITLGRKYTVVRLATAIDGKQWIVSGKEK
jgi:hypothetical protein